MAQWCTSRLGSGVGFGYGFQFIDNGQAELPSNCGIKGLGTVAVMIIRVSCCSWREGEYALWDKRDFNTVEGVGAKLVAAGKRIAKGNVTVPFYICQRPKGNRYEWGLLRLRFSKWPI